MSGAHGQFIIDAAKAEPRFHVQSDDSQIIKVADGELIACVAGTPVEIADFCGRVMKSIRWDAEAVVLDDIPPHPAALDRQDIEDAIGDALSHLALNGDDLTRAAGDVWATIVGAPVPGDTQP